MGSMGVRSIVGLQLQLQRQRQLQWFVISGKLVCKRSFNSNVDDDGVHLARMGRLLQHGCEVRIGFDSSVPQSTKQAWGDVPWVLDYSRLVHSRHVAEIARSFAYFRCMPARDALALEIAALFHDTGHLALSHTGDQLARKTLKMLSLQSGQVAEIAGTSAHLYGIPSQNTKTADANAVHHSHHILRHEERSKRILHNFLLGTLKGQDLSSPQARESLNAKAMFELCAWFMDPTCNARPANTWFAGPSPLSASTELAMDIDRCAYLIMDAPPFLRRGTEAAVRAWIMRECSHAESGLVKLRLLMHNHIYKAISDACLLNVESQTTLQSYAVRLQLCREAQSSSPPILCDEDVLPPGTKSEVHVLLSKETCDVFLSL